MRQVKCVLTIAKLSDLSLTKLFGYKQFITVFDISQLALLALRDYFGYDILRSLPF